MEKTLHTVSIVVGVFLITLLVGVGGAVLYQNRKAINLSSKSGLSDDDIEALKDPKAANKAAYDKMSREAWQRYQSQQPQPGWDQSWKK